MFLESQFKCCPGTNYATILVHIYGTQNSHAKEFFKIIVFFCITHGIMVLFFKKSILNYNSNNIFFLFKLVEYLCDGDEKIALATIQNWFIQVHVTIKE